MLNIIAEGNDPNIAVDEFYYIMAKSPPEAESALKMTKQLKK